MAEVPPRPVAEPPRLPPACLPNSVEPADQWPPGPRRESDEWKTSMNINRNAGIDERLESWMKNLDAKMDALSDICGAIACTSSHPVSAVGGSGGLMQKRASLIRRSLERAMGAGRAKSSTPAVFMPHVVPGSPRTRSPSRGPLRGPTEAEASLDFCLGKEQNAVLTRSNSSRSKGSGPNKGGHATLEAIPDSASSSTAHPTSTHADQTTLCTNSPCDEHRSSSMSLRIADKRNEVRKGASMASMETYMSLASEAERARGYAHSVTNASPFFRGSASPAKDIQLERKLKLRSESLRVDDQNHQGKPRHRLASILANKTFEGFITTVVVINALLIGAQTEFVAKNSKDTAAESFFFFTENVCTFIFLVELLARIFLHGPRFLTNPTERYWNLFDSFLVGVALLDFFITVILRGQGGGLPSSGAFLGKLLRALRLTRVMRILRTVRFVSELRVMVQMIVNSMLSLFWVLVILLALIYTFSIILTSGATEYVQTDTGNPPADAIRVQEYFGSLFETMYTLYKAIAGGLDWGEVSDLLRGPGWVYEAIIICYTLFTTFAVVNIVTGVFVDGAIELAKRDRTLLIHKHAKDQFAHEGHLIGLLQTIDSNGDDKISPEDFRSALQREDVKEFISAMHVEIPDVEAFFDMLDQNSDGEVDIVEFVTGMQKLRGEAKSVDIHMMMHQNMKTLQMVTGLVEVLCSEARELEKLRMETPPAGSDDVCSVGSTSRRSTTANVTQDTQEP